MVEFRWKPFEDQDDGRLLGPRRLPSADETDRQVEAELAEMFAELWPDDVHTRYPEGGGTFAAPRGHAPEWLLKKVAERELGKAGESD